MSRMLSSLFRSSNCAPTFFRPASSRPTVRQLRLHRHPKTSQCARLPIAPRVARMGDADLAGVSWAMDRCKVPARSDIEQKNRRQSVSIVVPTYREAANIPALVEHVHAALSVSGVEWELILADDDSNDGSDCIVADLAERHPVRLVTRRARYRDLSGSVLFGIRSARFDRIVVMDADLSHPPECIVNLLRALDTGCDMALGSRYAPGGVVDGSWGPWRFLVSRLATFLARPLVGCSDPMSGFFAIDRRAIPDPEALRPVGYKIALELMVRGELRVEEVPIGFRDRARGSSKMGLRQQLDFLRHLYRLYLYRYGGPMRLLCFGFVGASGFVIDVAFYLGLQWAGVEHRLARILSFWPAVSWNWLLNRHLTFRERAPEAHARQWTKFVVASLVGLTVNVGSYTLLTSFVGVFDRRRMLTLLIGVGLGGFVNFLLATLYVYRRHSAPRHDPEPESAG